PLFFGVGIDHDVALTLETEEEVLVPFSSGWVSIANNDETKGNTIEFSSPFLRGGYRSDTLTNAITTIFQASFLLSKNMTITSTRLYDMSLFLTNFIIITFILIVYYI
ncbi:hypothetical protein, partial [Staphylococcus sp. HMSC34G04]|uniref:hypothetical protein n=1 Tax=Staphylococcus sp. HMSC34G04 TaxID=1608860 RepID=UPI001C40AC76